MNVITVLGTRPEFIKARPVAAAFAQAGVRETIVTTGQHSDSSMASVFIQELGFEQPVIDLGVGSHPPSRQLATMLAGLSDLIVARPTDAILVYGDTTSTLAGTILATATDIPLIHVEAGLRSWDRRMPEERNRVLSDHASSLLLCPSGAAANNLELEGISGQTVVVVGDVNLDALLHFRTAAVPPPPGAAYGLLTLHRPSNVDEPTRLCRILDGIALSQMAFVWPVHPRTAARIEQGGHSIPPNLRLIPPVGFLEFVGLLEHAEIVVTDSGGVQKEAYWLARRCVTVRDQTEWTETVDAGWNMLVNDDPYLLSTAITTGVTPSQRPPLYGDGKAAVRAVDAIVQANEQGWWR